MAKKRLVETGASPRYLTFMIGLGAVAVLGQGLSMRALAGFHDEKAIWDAREEKRDELVVELNELQGQAVRARATEVNAVAEKEQAEREFAEVQAKLVSERTRLLEARDTYSRTVDSTAELAANAEGLAKRIEVLKEEQKRMIQQNAALEIAGQELGEVKQELNSKQAQVAELEGRQSRLLSELNTAQVALLDERGALGEVQQELAGARAVIAEGRQVELDLTNAKNELKDLQEKIVVEKAAQALAISAKENIANDISELQSELQELRDDRRKEQAEYVKLAREHSSVLSELDILRPLRSELVAEVEELGQGTARLKELALDLEGKLASRPGVEAELGKMKSEKQDLIGEIEGLRKEHLSLSESLASIKSDEAARGNRLSDLQLRLGELEGTIALREAEVASLEPLREQVRSLLARKSSIQEDLENLNAQRKESASELEAARSQIHAYEEQVFWQLKQLAEAIGTVLETPASENKSGSIPKNDSESEEDQ